MNSSVPSPSTVLERVDQLAPPRTPLTTPEVADEFDFDDGTVTAVVDVPHTATVREFIERLQRDAPGLELLARQTRARPLKTQSTFQAVCEGCLTSKQLSAIETAYFSGFFESPRKRTGQEVAASLDISQPTFTTHLRAAQWGICDLLFAAPTTTADS